MSNVAAPEGPVDAEVVDSSDSTTSQTEQAQNKVKTHCWWAMGAGLIPVPGLDLAAVFAAQIKLIKDLSDHYGVAFSEHRAKNLIGPLISSVGADKLLTGSISSLLKAIPGLGTIGGAAGMSVVAGASTYALGKVFVQHFESGGNLLDFDPAKMKSFFASQYEQGVQEAKAMKASGKAPAKA